jgi:transposase
LYWPAIQQVRRVLPQPGLLYIADSKMEALSIRARVAEQGDYYLVPLSQKGEQAERLTMLLQPVLEQKQALTAVYAPDTTQAEVIAQGYEMTHQQQAEIDGQVKHWSERVLVVYSPTLAAQSEQGLQQRLQRAEAKLHSLTPAPGRGKRPVTDLAHLQQAAETIVTQHRVSGLFSITYHEQRTQRHIRAYGQRPARSEEQLRYQVQVVRNEAAIAALMRQMGWRLYVTNVPADQLPLPEAVLAYRTGSSIERNFSRLKGRPLGLRPFYVQREDHVKGMVRLLSLALRILTLMEFVVRRSLQQQPEPLSGLYPGNPKQSTLCPTTERLLAAFKELTLTLVHLPGQHLAHVTPLTPLQQRILSLLDLSPSLYIDLALAPPNLA